MKRTHFSRHQRQQRVQRIASCASCEPCCSRLVCASTNSRATRSDCTTATLSAPSATEPPWKRSVR
eukprot:4363093-Prymnesium_polylepis.1